MPCLERNYYVQEHNIWTASEHNICYKGRACVCVGVRVCECVSVRVRVSNLSLPRPSITELVNFVLRIY